MLVFKADVRTLTDIEDQVEKTKEKESVPESAYNPSVSSWRGGLLSYEERQSDYD